MPFELQVAGAATLQRAAPLNPADPDQPVWQASQAQLAAQGASGMEYEPGTIGEATGIWDSLRVVTQRLNDLQEERKHTTDPVAAAALDGRIAELTFATQYTNDRRVLARYFVERFGFPMAGAASVEDPGGVLGGTIDTTLPWQVNFWFGAWDPDLLCMYMNGSLEVPYAANQGGGGHTVALKADTHGEQQDARIATVLPQAETTALEELGISPAELARLQKRIRGKVVVPGMPEYANARIGNQVYPHLFSPRIVVYCAAPGDVRVCLEAARHHGWHVTCRSGGHSSAGFSVNDGMVIDVSLMNYVAVDESKRRAQVGSGTNLGQLNAVLGTYGLHVPGGTCDDVGVAGHMMGGGYGFTSRQYGMNCDRVVGVTVMLADGEIVQATPDSPNADLLWAHCGGTGNQFGVLLDVTYELAELYELWGFCIRWDEAHSPAALDALQRGFMRTGAPDELGYLAVYTTFDTDPGLAVVGTYHGAADEGRRQLEPLLGIGSAKLTIDTTDTYAHLNDELLDVLPGIPPPPPGQGVYEAKQPGYVDKPLGADGWQQVIDYYRTTPNPYNIVVIEPYGGAIARVRDSAFVHRDVDMDFFVDSFWSGAPDGPKRDQAEEWLAGYLELVRPWMNGHVYQDYPWRGLEDYRWAFWGDAFDKLLAVKEKYDPDGFFHFEQSIRPGAGLVNHHRRPTSMSGGLGMRRCDLVRDRAGRVRPSGYAASLP